MVETDVTVNFIYKGSPITVQGTSEQTMDEMCRKFEGIFSINQNDVYYFYNDNVINRDNTFNDIVNINDRERGEMNVVVMKSNEEEEDEKKDDVKVNFIYKGSPTTVQGKSEQTMEEMCRKFVVKFGINQNDVYYLYNGNVINRDNTFNDIVNINDRERGEMNVVVYEEKEEEKKEIKCKYVLCPTCKEKAQIKLNNYKISIFGCKNGHHIKDMNYEDFEKTQNINESEIICDSCQEQNKYDATQNLFYICYDCKKKLCPLCEYKHDKTHNIINYDYKEYICKSHRANFNSYCKKCKKDLCLQCENSHNEHDLISYGKKLIKKENLIKNLNEIKQYKDELDIRIDEIIKKLESVKKNFGNYYDTIENTINTYDEKELNFETMNNIKEIDENQKKIKDELALIYNCKNLEQNVGKISKIYDLMTLKEDIIVYKIDKNKKETKIFGDSFVEYYKDMCKIECEGNIYDLKEYFDTTNLKNQEKLEIKLIGIENIDDMSFMFHNCTSLLYLPDVSKWDTSKVSDMKYMFYNCSSLAFLPDISKWNTSQVSDMSYMFYNCSTFEYLPDISGWNTSKVMGMSFMFYNCSSLIFFPDISKWDTSEVLSMRYMFHKCEFLKFLPDISKWNTSKVTNMSFMFSSCKTLTSLPDISKWKTNEEDRFMYNEMFSGCSKFLNIPDKFLISDELPDNKKKKFGKDDNDK